MRRLLHVHAALLLVLVPQIAAADLVFQSIVTATSSSDIRFSTPSINNRGEIAYVQIAPTGRGVYSATTLGSTLIAASPTHFTNYLGGPQALPTAGVAPHLNDSGVTAFWGNKGQAPAATHGIFKAENGIITTVLAADTPSIADSFSNSPQIASDGTVVFGAIYQVGGIAAGIYRSTGDNVELIAGNANHVGKLTTPAISDDGEIAYVLPTFNQFGLPTGDELFLRSGNTTTSIGLLSSRFFDDIDVNNDGTVIASTSHNVLLYNVDGILSTVAARSAAFVSFDEVSINNSGDLVFYATLTGQSAGIFRGGNSVTDKIIAIGDAFDGSKIKELSMSTQAINDEGTVAFWARLDNGSQGIYTVTVPEPSTFVLTFCAAIIGMAMVRRSRERSRS